jgi:Calcineurin-like phosphoesterase
VRDLTRKKKKRRRTLVLLIPTLLVLLLIISIMPPTTTLLLAANATTTTTTEEEEEEEDDDDVAAAAVSDFNIAAVGDWGCTPNAEDTVDNIVDRDPELVLGLGDYSYENSADCWFDIVDPIIDKMIIAIGDHEHNVTGEGENPGLLNEYMNRSGLEQQYYTYRYGNAFVLVMSQEVPHRNDSKQYDFVVNSLSKASSDPDVDWIIVASHNPFYNSPSVRPDFGTLRNTYHELFEEHGVDLVLSGDVHNYERTHPIVFNGNESASPIPTSTNGETYVDPEGQIFATVGTGGQSIQHPFYGKNPYIVTQFEGYGFLDIRITTTTTNDGGEKRLVGTFYDNDGGEIQDQFTVIKQGVG